MIATLLPTLLLLFGCGKEDCPDGFHESEDGLCLQDDADADTDSDADTDADADTDSDADADSDADTGISPPEAACAVVPDTMEIGETADWIGADSSDPQGEPITYRWTLVSKPEGSEAEFTHEPTDANVETFLPDLPGDYVGQLVVTNESGLASEPCTATLTANAPEGFSVELVWTHSGDDLDLHLVRGGDDETLLTTSDDCYYANCVSTRLPWGAIMEVDDIPGTGPEIISVDSPEDPLYTIYVQDYPGSIYYGENLATVTVLVGGAPLWEGTLDVDSEDAYFPVCTLDWGSREVTALY